MKASVRYGRDLNPPTLMIHFVLTLENVDFTDDPRCVRTPSILNPEKPKTFGSVFKTYKWLHVYVYRRVRFVTSGESQDGQSSVSHSDQDSDVSFESDNDEEIDAAEIEEEEDWVDYIKRSTNEAIEKMGNAED